MELQLIVYFVFCHIFPVVICIKHGQNLIWAQSPTISSSVSRLVGLSGNPSEWIKDGGFKVHHISAPHSGWIFKALSYQFDKQTLYWSEAMNKRIQGLVLNGSTETDKIVSGISPDVEGIAVDWISNNLYWSDSVFNWIKMTPLDSNYSLSKIVVQDDLHNPHGIAIHPQKGYLIWTDWGESPRLEMSDLLGKNRRIIVDDDILRPRGLVIDLKENVIYWVDSMKDTIECVAFNGNDRKIITKSEGSTFYGIALYEQYIFVTEQSKGHLKIYDKYTGSNLISYRLNYIPYSIVMYDNALQPGNSSKCSSFGCEQICVEDPITGPMCLCADGYKSDIFDKTCSLESKFHMPVHVYSVDDAICQYPANFAYISLVNITLENQCYLSDKLGYLALTYDARNKSLYFSTNNTKTISKIQMEEDANASIVIGGTGIVKGLALDWMTGNLYWTDSTFNVIKVARYDGMYQRNLIIDLIEPFGIAVHPKKGIIFWTEQGMTPKIKSAYMDGSKINTLIKDDLGSPNHLFIDFKSERLYWTDSILHHVKYVELVNGKVSVLYSERTAQFNGLSLFKDFLLWTDVDDLNGLHIARIDTLEKVRGVIHPAYGVTNDLITFDIRHQPYFDKDENGLPLKCSIEYNECQQLCLSGPNSSFHCKCALGYKLAKNNRLCTFDFQTDNFLIVNDAYQRQMFQINADNGIVNALNISIKYQPIAVDYDPQLNIVYWSDNKDHVLQSASITDGKHRLILKLLPGSVVDGLAVDYLNHLLYYTDTGLNIIGVVSTLNISNNIILLHTGMDEPRAIVVLPDEGILFWTDWGFEPKIEIAQMDGTERQSFLVLEKNSWPNGLAIDRKDKILFWADAKHNRIESIGFDKSNHRILLQETTAHYFGLFSMGRYLYITDWTEKFVSRLPKEGGSKEKFGHGTFTRLYGIYGFNSSEIVQGQAVCRNSRCEHLCLPKPNNYFACKCRSGYFLGYDMISCEQGIQSSTPTSSNVSIEISTLSVSLTTLPTYTEQSSINTSNKPNETDKTYGTTVENDRNNNTNPSSVIGLVLLFTTFGILVTILAIYIVYKRYFVFRNTHEKLVEDTGTEYSYHVTIDNKE